MVNPDRHLVLVLVTFPDETAAASVARTLLEERLVACVNVLPAIRSLYRWDGAVQDEAEHLAILKGTSDGLERLSSRIVELHPYDTPEVVAVDPAFVDPRYAAWALAATEAPGDADR